MDPREQLIQLSADRTQYLTAAENALQGGDQEAFDTAMERVRNINGQIENVQALVREQERRMDEAPASGAEQRDMMNERGNDLMQGRAVTFTANELRRGLRAVNSTTLAAATLVEPTGTGTEIRDPVGGGVSRAGDILTDAVTAGYKKYAFHSCRETPIKIASLGNDAGIYGAVRLVKGADEAAG